ncbi:hypothetical protein VTH82DRAFT_6731 [Thermothelomyces myriococcoides]
MAATTMTTRKVRKLSSMVCLAGFVAILGLLQPALAVFYTVTENCLIITTAEAPDGGLCTGDCQLHTYTTYRTINPTVTPTGKAVSTSTDIDEYMDAEIVSVFFTDGVYPDDLLPTDAPSDHLHTRYAVMATWTAPSSCPTPFTVVTYVTVPVFYRIGPYLGGEPTGTSFNTQGVGTEPVTYVTEVIEKSKVAPSALSATMTEYYYTNFVQKCRNPTASDPREFYGPSYTGGGLRPGDAEFDRTHYLNPKGCGIETWVIVVATVLPTVFLLGFIESYFWFRRMMLGKPALRLGTFCWCCLCLWFILLTRRSPRRSPRDQVMLRQFWNTLSARVRIKLWLKHGFRWRYPVELIGNPDSGKTDLPVFGPPTPRPRPGDRLADANGQAPPPPPPSAPAQRAELPSHEPEKQAQQQQQQQQQQHHHHHHHHHHSSYINHFPVAQSPVELPAHQSALGPVRTAPGAEQQQQQQQQSSSYSPPPVNKEAAELP